MSDWSYVNTKASYYSGKGIKFLGIPAIDLKHYPLNLHFQGKTRGRSEGAGLRLGATNQNGKKWPKMYQKWP
jgi:hypothetical protein